MISRKWLAGIGLLVLLTLVMSFMPACAKPAPPPAPAPKPHEQVALACWGGPFGGTLYTTMFAFMDSLNKTHPWLKGSIIESKGSWDNILHSGEDKAKRPFTMAATDYGSFYMSVTGAAKPMEGKKPIPKGDRLIITTIAHSAQLVVTFDPNIKTGKDLIGKRVAGWTMGSGAWTTLEYMFKEWGISFDDLKSYDGMGSKARISALKDGLVDAIHVSEPFVPGKPDVMSSVLSELLAHPKPLYYIAPSKEAYERAAPELWDKGKFPYPWKEIPAGHYSKDWAKGGANVVLMAFWVYDGMSEEIEYEIAKTLIEKSDMIAAHGAQAALLVPSVLVGAIPVKFQDQIAPGALKYYKEKGLIAKYWKK